MISGVYSIRNRLSTKEYIGSSLNIEERWKSHLRMLNTASHHSKALQSAFNKYGAGAFSMFVIEECYQDRLAREQYFIDTLKPAYNCSPKAIGGSPKGIVFSEEHKLHIAEAAARGKKYSVKSCGIAHPWCAECRPDIAKQIGEDQWTLELRKIAATHSKLSRGFSGKLHSKESKEKISSLLRGKTKSPEHVAKIRASIMARNLSIMPET